MKLFVKIFLWFLTAVALMFGVIIFVTRTFQTEPSGSRWQRGAKNQLMVYGGTAAQIFDQQGEPGLRIFVERLDTVDTFKEVDVVDRRGHVMIGNAGDLADFSKVIMAADASGAPQVDVTTEETPMGAAPIDLSDGQRVFLLLRWEAYRAPSLFFDSWLGNLRFAGLLLTAIIVCYALALYLTSPIRKLREATQKLAGGDLQTRVAPQLGRRHDELGDLARDFDMMAERIDHLITSQQRLNRDISHELRSPLARMSVALEIAKQRSGPENQALLDRIETEATRLNEMIGRLLTLAKLESGAEDIERAKLDLAEIVRDVAADAEFEAQATGKFVEVSEADHCTVIGSDNLLRSAIENVLRNAVRYTRERTVVDVALKAQNGHAVLRISDHGGGVPETELPNLFRPFYRVGEARERKTGGIGLGLAIAQRAIEAHRGSISAKNAGDGLSVEIILDRIDGKEKG